MLAAYNVRHHLYCSNFMTIHFICIPSDTSYDFISTAFSFDAQEMSTNKFTQKGAMITNNVYRRSTSAIRLTITNEFIGNIQDVINSWDVSYFLFTSYSRI